MKKLLLMFPLLILLLAGCSSEDNPISNNSNSENVQTKEENTKNKEDENQRNISNADSSLQTVDNVNEYSNIDGTYKSDSGSQTIIILGSSISINGKDAGTITRITENIIVRFDGSYKNYYYVQDGFMCYLPRSKEYSMIFYIKEE